MSLNINSVNSTGISQPEPIQKQDIIPLPGQLPIDLIPNILKNVPAAKITDLALVCRKWKEIVDDKDFERGPLPQNFYGRQKVYEITGWDGGKESSFPRWIYACMAKGGHIFTWVPKTATKIQDDGTKLKVELKSLAVIGDLFANAVNKKNGEEIGFSPNSWPDALKDIRPLEEGHWVLISKKEMGRKMTYSEQVDEAKRVGAKVSDAIDTAFSWFMEEAVTGDRPYRPYGRETWVRVNDQTKLGDKNYRLWFGFVPSGLNVFRNHDARALDFVAFAPAWKSFGT
jgi:hypothetical protein